MWTRRGPVYAHQRRSSRRRAYNPAVTTPQAPSLTQLSHRRVQQSSAGWDALVMTPAPTTPGADRQSRGTCASDACGMDAYPAQQRACLDGSWSRAQHRWVVVGVSGGPWDGMVGGVQYSQLVKCSRQEGGWFRTPAVAELHVTYSLTTAAPSLPCLTTASPPIGPAQSPCSGAETDGSQHAPLGRRTVPKRV
ncbi:hypothetical protein O988_08725, partial [Pseudogymnoascus sp. VKM F-3808]